MMNFRQIRAFVAVYEARSFSRAAEREHATQSGLSMQVANLEAALKITLFERTPTGVTPTQAGQRLYRRASEILRSMSAAESEMEALAEDVSGHIRIGLMPAFTLGILAPVLAGFMARYPNVDLTIIEGFSPALIEGVARSDFDFAIVPNEQMPPGITAHYFGSDREILVSGARSPLRHLVPVSFGDLASMKLVLPTHGNARRARLETLFAAHAVPLSTVLEIDAMVATLELVAATDWVTILPATICARDFDGKARKLNQIMAPQITVDYVLIEPSHRSLSPSARLFLDALREAFEHIHQRWESVLGTLSDA